MHYKVADDAEQETDALQLLSLKLFRFGLLMFLMAVFFGMWLWQGFGIGGAWLHIKLGLVGLLFGYFMISGLWLYRAIKRGIFPNGTVLRIFNELSLLFVIPIIYLAVSKTVG